MVENATYPFPDGYNSKFDNSEVATLTELTVFPLTKETLATGFLEERSVSLKMILSFT